MARILLVDDNELLVTSMSRFLKAGGHEVFSARNGFEANEKMLHETFDVIVTDIVMPDRDGMEMLSELRRNRATARVIAISGDDSAPQFQYLKVAEKLGADMTLAKPFTGDMLLNSVDLMVELGPKEPKSESRPEKWRDREEPCNGN